MPRSLPTREVPSTLSMRLGETHADWMAIYNRHRPAEGHVIKKGSRYYYAFFSQTPGEQFMGTVELRGLDPIRYMLTDYITGQNLGEATGPNAKLKVDFKDALLLAEPVGLPIR